jgi:hypothetical protein
VPQSYTYLIEVTADALNEARLRDFLEIECGASDVAIRRVVTTAAPVQADTSGLSAVGKAVVEQLSDHKPHRRKAIIAALEAKGITVQPALFRSLEDRGAIRKVRHGIYASVLGSE